MNWNEQGGAAFPIPHSDKPGAPECEWGMSLRDWFAGNALSALISKSPFFDRDGEFGNPVDMMQFKADMSESAYFYADAMLEARK